MHNCEALVLRLESCPFRTRFEEAYVADGDGCVAARRDPEMRAHRDGTKLSNFSARNCKRCKPCEQDLKEEEINRSWLDCAEEIKFAKRVG